MSQLVKILPVLVIIYIFVGYLYIDLFYSPFGITINYWISVDEIFTLFISDLSRFAFISMALFVGVFSIMKLREVGYAEGFINSLKNPVNVIGFINYAAQFIVLGAIIWYILVQRPSNANWIFNLPLAVIVLFMISCFILFEIQLVRFFGTPITITGLFFSLVVIAALINAIPTSMFKIENRLKLQTASIILKDDSTVDSLIFVGKSKYYYYLFRNRISPQGDSTLVISKQCVKKLNLQLRVIPFINENNVEKQATQFVVIEDCQ